MGGGNNVHTVVTDLTVHFCSPTDPPSTSALDPRRWQRIERELYLHTAAHSAWLHIAQAKEEELAAHDLVVTDIRVGELQPSACSDNNSWESRPGGIWVQRSNYAGGSHRPVTGVDVLFGIDAVDPRPQWALSSSSLQLLNTRPEVPVARLTVRHGRAKPRPDGPPRTELRVREDGKFKIVQISDTHLVTGVGVCKDAIDAHGQLLPESEADPLTIDFLGEVLDVEKPDLVVLTGDQLHHDILDSQSALFKLVAPMAERSIPYAAVFGNHDDEASAAGTEQMSLLQDLPFSLCQPGPERVGGVGNYYLQIFAHAPASQLPLSTLYFLDSNGEIPATTKRNPDYDCINQSQIDWFTGTSQALREARDEESDNHTSFHLSLAFIHIPLPEYADSNLILHGGHLGEPVMCPSFNSHYYDALTQEGVAALSCGHDHVNDFCGLLPRPPHPWHELKTSQQEQDGKSKTPQLGLGLGPWLCCGGSSGFGAYGSYGGKHYHRRARVWEIDTGTGSIRTWKRVEYTGEIVDELVLAERGAVVASPPDKDGGQVA